MPRCVAVLLIFSALAPSVPAVAGTDGARFTIFAGGREAGWERAALTRDELAVTLSCRAELRRDDRRQELSLELELDAADGGLRRFVARGEQAGREQVVTLARDGGVLLGERRRQEETEVLRIEPEPGALVLADPFAGPWMELARRYDFARGGRQTFPAIFPLTGEKGTVTVLLREEEALELDGRAVLAYRLFAEPSTGETANLWVDAEGRLLVCARSVAGLSAVRGADARIGLPPGEDPPDPEGVVSRRLRFSAEGLTLSGTMTWPVDRPARVPAVLILSGSGPQDRNGNAPGAELQWNLLHSLAAALAEAGIASLRYDERGVGRSGGTFHDASFADLLSDARSALDYLRSREDILPDRLAVAGHSEGALLGARLALEGGVAVLVTIGAPAEPLDRVLLAQVRARLARRGAPEGEAGRILGEMRAFFEHVRLSTGETVNWRGRRRQAMWLREHLAQDPLDLFGGVEVPVLALHGERDGQVPAEHARRMGRVLRRGDVRVLPGLDHYLMRTRDGVAEYGEARRRADPSALGLLATLLRARLTAHR